MGEWSKTVGEFGEKTVEKFLNLVGWADIPKGIELPCIKEEHDKKTHGIDFYKAYKSKLVDNELVNVAISVKYTSNPYPNSPNSLFKEYYEDIAYAIECFNFNVQKIEINKNFNNYDRVKNVAVIFWLSNSIDTYDDVISKVTNIRISGSFRFDSLFLVDNKRIDFIYQSIKFAKQYFDNSEINFFYQDTGKNINPLLREHNGKELPVEFFNTSILALRIENKETKKISLCVTTIDPFTQSDLKRLIGLINELSKNLTSETYIAFPNYNELSHGSDVRIVKSAFANKSNNKLEILSYKNDFRN
jgi:hypothetical protein